MKEDTSYELCSFCNKHKDDVKKLIVANDVAICNDCVDLCQKLLQEDPVTREHNHTDIDPQELKRYLDQYVIGQDRANQFHPQLNNNLHQFH